MATNSNPLEFGAYAARGMVARILDRTRATRPSWWGKRAIFLFRRLAIALLKGRPVDAEAFGARFRLYPYENVCEKRILFAPHTFDPIERDFLAPTHHHDFVFLDVGANVGGYALAMAAKAGPRARIIALEPQPRVFERLSYNIAASGFATVKAHPYAISDRDGDVVLFLNARNQGEASVKIKGSAEAEEVTVAARSLLSLIREEGLDHVDAMKIDIEGLEDIVLKAFFEEAPRALWPRKIVMERSEARWGFDLHAYLLEKGYRVARDAKKNHLLALPCAEGA